MGIESILTKQKEYDFWNTDDSNLMSDYKVDPFEQFNRDIDNAKTPKEIKTLMYDFLTENNRFLNNTKGYAELASEIYDAKNLEEAKKLATKEIPQYFNFF